MLCLASSAAERKPLRAVNPDDVIHEHKQSLPQINDYLKNSLEEKQLIDIDHVWALSQFFINLAHRDLPSCLSRWPQHLVTDKCSPFYS